jgi:peptidoglycan/LPS O-acetylase OafA/YrhL
MTLSQVRTAVQGETRHYATLDGFRGIAAVAVLLHHICQLVHLGEAIPHAYLAVDFFFVLSGFVVAKAYEARLMTSMTFSDFVKVRLVRLYPLILVGVVLGAFVLAVRLIATHDLAEAGDLWLATISALVLLPTATLFSLYPGMLFPVNPPEWSLFFELTVNFIYAPLVRWLTAGRLTIILAMSGVALFLAAMSPDALNIGHTAQSFFAGFPRVLFSFFLGVLLFRYRPAGRLGPGASLFLGVLLAAVLLAPFLKENWFYDIAAVTLIFPPIVLIGSMCETGPRLNRVWLWLGELSYPLYITHHPIGRMIANGFEILHLHLAPAFTIAACALGAVCVAELLLVLWDRPVRKWFSNRV